MRVTGDKNIVAHRLALARQNHEPSWSQDKLAEVISTTSETPMDRGTIAKIETQQRGAYDYEIAAFARALEVSTDWLLGLDNEQ